MKGKWIWVQIIWLSLLWPAAAATDTLSISDFKGKLILSEHFQVFQAPVAYIDSTELWESVDHIQGLSRDTAYVIPFTLENPGKDTQEYFIKLPDHERGFLYTATDTQYCGSLSIASERSYAQLNDILHFKLPAGVHGFRLMYYNHSSRLLPLGEPSLLDAENFYRDQFRQEQRNRVGVALSIFFQGGIWVTMLYMFFMYFQNKREKLYLWYSLYMFAAMYYMLAKVAGDGPFYFLFEGDPRFRQVTNEPIQWLIYILYNLFVMHFLEVRKFSVRLYKVIQWVNGLYLAYFLFISNYLLFSFDKTLVDTLYLYTRPVVIGISVYLLVELYLNVRTKLTKYVISGSVFFMVFSIIAMLHSVWPSYFSWVPFYAINWMQIGIMAEILCFSLGIGRRIRMTNYQKAKMHQAYISQLVRNEEMVQEYNRELEAEVERQTKEVKQTMQALEEQKQQKIEAEYQKQLMHSEMQSLRLQMNPHFIFNSLNSIRYYILKEDSEKASDYITIFSKLLRMILQNSKQATVKLSAELKALKLYLEFEKQRFESRFEYSIEVSEEVESDHIEIQPLIIQPFVENSIWHGLLHKDGVGQLKIALYKSSEDELTIEIEDNGIGRERSKEMRKDSSHRHKSFGMQITRDRLRLMGKIKDLNSGFEIKDLVDPEGQPLGTRVIIKIKLHD